MSDNSTAARHSIGFLSVDDLARVAGKDNAILSFNSSSHRYILRR